MYLISTANAVPLDWQTSRVIAEAKNLGCLRWCGQVSFADFIFNMRPLYYCFSLQGHNVVGPSSELVHESSEHWSSAGIDDLGLILLVVLLAAIAALSIHAYKIFSNRKVQLANTY